MTSTLQYTAMNAAKIQQLDKLLQRHGPCNQWMKSYVDERNGNWIGGKLKVKNMTHAINAGGRMEDTAELIRLAGEDLKKARSELDHVCREIGKLTDVVIPLLHSHLQAIRTTRMTLESESRQCLNTLHDVRKFFLESDYKTETDRLKEFLDIIAQFKKYQSDGTLDLMADVILKLAIRGGTDGRE